MSTTICRRNMSALRSRLCSFRRINCTSTHQITKRTFYLYSPEPFHPIHGREPVWKSAEEAVEVIKSKQKVYVQGGAASPLRLITALVEHGKKEKLKDIEVIHAPTQLQCTFSHPENEGIFRTNSFYVSDPKVRQAIKEGRGDFIPIFLSEIPLLFRRGLLNLDVAMISLSPLDGHGFCSLGPNVDCTRSAVQNAKFIIGLVNENVPRTFGDGIIHSSHVDVMVESHEPLPEFTGIKLTPEIHEIARLIADDLVQDNATIQTGIGSLPNAVFDKLIHHKNLGIHTEMFSDGVIDLVEKGAITNAFKTIQTGKIVSSFALGTKRLYDFLDDNSFVAMCDCSFTNNISLICQNPRVTAINTCLEIDLTGQVCADSIGSMIYTGVGGQVDFIRGAALSLDGEGVPIIACPATAIMGDTITSRIVPSLKPGAGVVTTRAHVHYIVTEYGITNLFGKNLRQRAYELIKLAHPNYREDLEKAAFERLRVMPSP